MQDAFGQFKAWYFTKPLFTRTYLAACTTLTLLITLRLVASINVIYSLRAVIPGLQLWRPFTAIIFMGKFDFGFIFNIYFAYIAISKVETQVFSKQRYADFLWLIVMLFGGCLIIGSIFGLMVLTQIFLMSLIYIWCKRMPHEQIRIMFGFLVKTGYFPFVYAIMMTLFGGNILNYIFGILLGHSYIFVKDIALARYQRDYLPTPVWFTNWWFGRQARAAVHRPNVGGAFQGRGVRME